MAEQQSSAATPQSSPASMPSAGRRCALIVAQGSEEALKSGKKISELLGYTPHGYNFEISSIFSRRSLDNVTTNADDIYDSLETLGQELTSDDHLVVYLCLRNSKVDIDLHRILALRTAAGTRLKNFLVILDMDHTYNFEEDCFRKLDFGVVVLSMAGHDLEGTYRNGKYTYFSGLLIEALKGGAADEYGLITVANVYSYLQEATLMHDGIRPMLRSVMSESMLLRRVAGILSEAELRTLCESFPIVYQEKSILNVDVRDEEEVASMPALQSVLPALIEKQLVVHCNYSVIKQSRKRAKEPSIYGKIISVFSHDYELAEDKPRKEKRQGYMLTAYGKHCRDMWHNKYFLYI